ncbi:MAG: quinolinate synthase NadA [Rhodospirillales bacterium]|jgi:quinolinate synthase|nr:quinolinate synthase NadA [Rhodospirillales bacterium]
MLQTLNDNPDYTPAIAARTAPVYERVKSVISEAAWPYFAPDVDEVLRLKRERNAVILAHNYMTPDIYHCVSDIGGDSLALAQRAMDVEADVIVLCGVHFMAETAKLLNPEKTVIIPDPAAGCSLAESISGADIRKMRRLYPGVPVVTYVNTSAEVKAESDVCCTSANAKLVVESLGVDRVMLLPDEYLARNVAAVTDVEIITFPGRCEVHETFTADQVVALRRAHPDVTVLAHPECAPEVLQEVDYAGSTSGMADYVRDHQPPEVALITECSMSDNLISTNPRTRFIRSCSLCPHMQRITMENIAEALREMKFEVTINASIASKARRAVENMLKVGRG